MNKTQTRQTARQAEAQIRTQHAGKGATAKGVASPSPIPRQSGTKLPAMVTGKRK
ncbi:MAG TPA: hypothetical protein VE008_02455 [Burkholderiales bacterium]|nr:hypothetical protein [Burkholderiales bacterium]